MHVTSRDGAVCPWEGHHRLVPPMGHLDWCISKNAEAEPPATKFDRILSLWPLSAGSSEGAVFIEPFPSKQGEGIHLYSIKEDFAP